MIKLNNVLIQPTIFPDKTSQIWKVDEKLLKENSVVTWNFSYEAELIHLAQLKTLLDSSGVVSVKLYIDYLPYARQDKHISNNSTFALFTFASILNYLEFDEVIIQDPHSYRALTLINKSNAVYPENKIKTVIKELQIDTICYPDKGANTKYNQVYNFQDYNFQDCNIIIGDKIRNQSTGKITSYKILGINNSLKTKNILIIDDICDGGATFEILTKELLKYNVNSINLFVTHGIFSKGLKSLFEAGISRIFTPKGEAINIHDTWGFKK